MIKRILVALDSDPDTPVATTYAIQLARNFEASLTGLAVVDSEEIASHVGGGGIGTIYYAEQLREFMTENTRREAGNLLSAFEQQVEKAEVRHTEIMEEGAPFERIIEDMKYHDLLVVGRDSHFYYNRPERETKTLEKVVKKGNAPTLVVTDRYQDVNRVLVAFDGSSAAARTLQWFIHLQPYGSELEIRLVHVCPENSEECREKSNLVLRLAEDYLKAHNYKNLDKEILVDGSPGDKLLEYRESYGADLMLLGAHSVSAIRRITFGSTTFQLVKESPVPLFLCH